MNVGFSGSRKRGGEADRLLIRKLLGKLHWDKDVVVHGGCKIGIDAIVEEEATKLDLVQIIYYPQDETTAAFLERNNNVVAIADVLHAFPTTKDSGEKAMRGIPTKGGTEYTIRKARERGLPVLVY